jgi:hypothetical protein
MLPEGVASTSDGDRLHPVPGLLAACAKRNRGGGNEHILCDSRERAGGGGTAV